MELSYNWVILHHLRTGSVIKNAFLVFVHPFGRIIHQVEQKGGAGAPKKENSVVNSSFLQKGRDKNIDYPIEIITFVS